MAKSRRDVFSCGKGENIEEMAQEVEVMIESFGEEILEHVPIDTLLGLRKFFLAPMSPAFWESLRSQLDPTPTGLTPIHYI